jgi:adenylate kinase family enzyme
MKRVVVLGPGASGKTALAIRLREITGLPVIELDKIFWRPGLAATPRDEWIKAQERLVEGTDWILDGDLGPNDAVEVRLRAADTVIFLDFSIVRCAWRAIRRSRERADFWLWLLRYRRQGRPLLMEAITKYAGGAALHVIGNPRALRRFVAELRRNRPAESRKPVN